MEGNPDVAPTIDVSTRSGTVSTAKLRIVDAIVVAKGWFLAPLAPDGWPHPFPWLCTDDYEALGPIEEARRVQVTEKDRNRAKHTACRSRRLAFAVVDGKLGNRYTRPSYGW